MVTGGSGYGEYLKAPAQRLVWLRVDRSLGEPGIPKESVAGWLDVFIPPAE